MPAYLAQLLVAAAVTLVVGVVTGDGWPAYVVGAVLALSLWVMLLAGSYSHPGGVADMRVPTRQYALAAALAVAFGWAMYVVGDGATWWAVGFILAGVLVPAGSAATDRSRSGDSA
ncbi:MAG: hypothetical protein HOP97_01705 [Terrabacter sp.]|nr:hypothetical protein [Terrabacter sp.]